MHKNSFWRIIDASLLSSRPETALLEQLATYPPEETISFYVILRGELASVYSADLVIANFIVRGYTSDDAFEKFRAWLVSLGSECFMALKENIESLAEWFNPDDVRCAGGEWLLFVGQRAYEEYGDEDHFYDKVFNHPDFKLDPELEIDWSNSEIVWQQRFPHLFETFWDQNDHPRD